LNAKTIYRKNTLQNITFNNNDPQSVEQVHAMIVRGKRNTSWNSARLQRRRGVAKTRGSGLVLVIFPWRWRMAHYQEMAHALKRPPHCVNAVVWDVVWRTCWRKVDSA
jgi:hypothetical protein